MIDKITGFFKREPKVVVKKEVRPQTAFFEAADAKFYGGIRTFLLGMDETPRSFIEKNLEPLRNRSRLACANNPFFKKYLEEHVLSLVPKGGMKFGGGNGNTELLDLIKYHSRIQNFSFEGGMDRPDTEGLWVKMYLRDGGFFLIRRVVTITNEKGVKEKKFYLQTVDPATLSASKKVHPHRITEGNKIIMGIELDKNNRRVAYHFSKSKDDLIPYGYNIGNYTTGGTVRVDAKDVFHFFTPDYPNQIREVPQTSAGLVKAWEIKEFDRSTLNASIIAGLYNIYAKNETGEVGEDTLTPPTDDERVSPETEEKPKNKVVGISPHDGRQMAIFDSETELDTVSSNFPDNHESVYYSQIEALASALGIPVHLLASRAGGSNFGELQAFIYSWGLKIERMTYKFRNAHLFWIKAAVEVFLQNNARMGEYDKWMEDIESLTITNYQVRGSDPVKVAKANEVYLKNGVKSRTQVAAENGCEWDEQSDQLLEENKKLGVTFESMSKGGSNSSGERQEDEEEKDE